MCLLRRLTRRLTDQQRPSGLSGLVYRHGGAYLVSMVRLWRPSTSSVLPSKQPLPMPKNLSLLPPIPAHIVLMLLLFLLYHPDRLWRKSSAEGCCSRPPQSIHDILHVFLYWCARLETGFLQHSKCGQSAVAIINYIRFLELLLEFCIVV